jgi:hypothetical protein
MLIYRPVKATDRIDNISIEKYYATKALNITSRDYFLTTPDNEKIHCVLLKNNNEKTIFLYSHGNSGNIDNKIYSSKTFSLLQHSSVLLYDYRGYGRSSGSPFETGMHADIETVWLSLLKEYLASDIILYGKSLGCTNVLSLGSVLVKLRMDLPRAIIAESGFSDAGKIADTYFRGLRYLMLDNFNNLNYVKNINVFVPIYVFHSKNDEVIDISHAYDLENTKYCAFYEITGTHSKPIYNENYYNIIRHLAEPKCIKH